MYSSLFTTFTLACVAQAAIVGRAVTEQTLLTNMTVMKPTGDIYAESYIQLGIFEHPHSQYAGKGVDIYYGWRIRPPTKAYITQGGGSSIVSACNDSVSGEESLFAPYAVLLPGEYTVTYFAEYTFVPFDGEYNATRVVGWEPTCGEWQGTEKAIYEFNFTALEANETETGEIFIPTWESQTISLSPAPSGLLSDVTNGARTLVTSVWMMLGVVGVLVVA